jgi:hypothetical protein
VAINEAIKKLQSMRASAANKSEDDMELVASGFGFDVWEGKKHTTYQHPKYRQLIGQWPRHRSVLPTYVRQLIKVIDRLEVLEGENRDG